MSSNNLCTFVLPIVTDFINRFNKLIVFLIVTELLPFAMLLWFPRERYFFGMTKMILLTTLVPCSFFKRISFVFYWFLQKRLHIRINYLRFQKEDKSFDYGDMTLRFFPYTMFATRRRLVFFRFSYSIIKCHQIAEW